MTQQENREAEYAEYARARKKKRNLIFGVLGVLAVGAVGVAIYNNSKKEGKVKLSIKEPEPYQWGYDEYIANDGTFYLGVAETADKGWRSLTDIADDIVNNRMVKQ